MLRTALACCALLACKGSPPEDHRAPARAPVVESEPADAAMIDAPAAPCFAMPFTSEAEQAGVHRLAHHVPAASKAPAKLRDMVKLVVGKPTVVPGLRPWKAKPLGVTPPPPPRPPLSVIEAVGADALIAMAKWPHDKLTLIAPAHLEGAVVRISGATSVTLAIGDAGTATLARYREHYVKPRIANTLLAGGGKLELEPLAIMLDDVDGDGTLEQISFSSVGGVAGPPTSELGILWESGELAFVRSPSVDVAPYYVVPPTLNSGKPMLVTLSGQRVVLDGKTLTSPPGGLVSGEKRCLQTSTTEPATIVPLP